MTSRGLEWSKRLKTEVAKAVIGQEQTIEKLLVALVANGHVLLEGMPGLAKTLLVKTLAKSLGVQFERLQFTPDLLPSDVIGTMIYQPKENQFAAHLGPIFANLVLADEINRSPAKVQSALLEAMQERQVTLGGNSHPLPAPFFVMATQNPLEQEGTYPLPEAQMDRFLFKLIVDYPSEAEERLMVSRWGQLTNSPEVQVVSSGEELIEFRAEVDQVHLSEDVLNYILALVRGTRKNASSRREASVLSFGASPRASLALSQSSRALAWMRGKTYVTPEIVQELYYDVMRHRVGLSYESEAEEKSTDDVLSDILKSTAIPRIQES